MREVLNMRKTLKLINVNNKVVNFSVKIYKFLIIMDLCKKKSQNFIVEYGKNSIFGEGT